MKKENLKLVAISATVTFLLMLGYESTKELIFKGTLSPWQSHWVTILFTTMVSCIVVLFALNHLASLKERIHSIKLHEERLETLRRTMQVVNHHVNNLTNSLYLIEAEVEDNGGVTLETLQELRHSMDEVTKTLQGISRMAEDEEEFSL